MVSSFPKLCLRWNNHTTNLLSALDSLLLSEQHSDVTLACQGAVWHLHRLVLSASSTHFAALLAEVTPGQLPLIIVDGPSREDIMALISFIYHGEVSVDQEHLPELLKTAAALKIKGLAELPVDGTSSSCQTTIASTHLLQESAPSTSQANWSLDHHPKKQNLVKSVQEYSSEAFSAGDNVVNAEEPVDEILPLNLSCKRDQLGKSLNEDHSCLQSSDGILNVPVGPRSIVRTEQDCELVKSFESASSPHIIQEYPRENIDSSLQYTYISQNQTDCEKKPCYILSYSASKPVVLSNTGSKIQSHSHVRHVNVSESWKSPSTETGATHSKLTHKKIHPTALSYSVVTQYCPSSSTTNFYTPVSKDVLDTATHLHPPLKRLRISEHDTDDLVTDTSLQTCGQKSSPHYTGVAVTSPSISQRPDSVPYPRMPPKKCHEIITAQAAKVRESERILRPSIANVPKYKVLSVKNEQIPIKHEQLSPPIQFPLVNDIAVNVQSKQSACIKQESFSPVQPIALKDSLVLPVASSLQTSHYSVEKPNLSPIYTVPVSNSSPIKRSQFSLTQPIFGSVQHPSETTSLSPKHLSPKHVSVLPSTVSPSDKKYPIYELPTQSLVSGKDPVICQSIVGASTSVLTSSSPSRTGQPGGSPNTASGAASSAVLTVSSVASTSSDGSAGTSSTGRVSVNMRTFKEEWRRQLLVDYDSRTNMSICMLCFTTFKSYDGPRKNTYVKHAKRFHTSLEDYSEEERDAIIKKYELEYKSGINSGLVAPGGAGATNTWSSRGHGKGCRAVPVTSAGTPASSSSCSSGSGSQPGSRPDTDGEDDNHCTTTLTGNKSRCGSPESDGSVEVTDCVPPKLSDSKSLSGKEKCLSAQSCHLSLVGTVFGGETISNDAILSGQPQSCQTLTAVTSNSQSELKMVSTTIAVPVTFSSTTPALVLANLLPVTATRPSYLGTVSSASSSFNAYPTTHPSSPDKSVPCNVNTNVVITSSISNPAIDKVEPVPRNRYVRSALLVAPSSAMSSITSQEEDGVNATAVGSAPATSRHHTRPVTRSSIISSGTSPATLILEETEGSSPSSVGVTTTTATAETVSTESKLSVTVPAV